MPAPAQDIVLLSSLKSCI